MEPKRRAYQVKSKVKAKTVFLPQEKEEIISSEETTSPLLNDTTASDNSQNQAPEAVDSPDNINNQKTSVTAAEITEQASEETTDDIGEFDESPKSKKDKPPVKTKAKKGKKKPQNSFKKEETLEAEEYDSFKDNNSPSEEAFLGHNANFEENDGAYFTPEDVKYLDSGESPDNEPDSWNIQESEYGTELTFLKNDEAITVVPLTKDLANNLTDNFRKFYPVDAISPNNWIIKAPEGNPNGSPQFTLRKDAEILASLPLTQEVLESLLPVLKNLYVEPVKEVKPPVTKRIMKWAEKHKFQATLTALVLIPGVYIVLSSIYNQIVAAM